MVRSENFSLHQFIGNPMIHVERMLQWDVDELVVINISRNRLDQSFSHNRRDYPKTGVSDLPSFISQISSDCRIPLTFGGRLRSLKHIETTIANGADKAVINSMLFNNITDTNKAIEIFGSQAIVASVDYRYIEGQPKVVRSDGSIFTEIDVYDWCKRCEDIGVGEILLTCVDNEGVGEGYDMTLIDLVSSNLSIPVIASGGAGHHSDFWACLEQTQASAVAAGNMFHFTENSYPRAKQFLRKKNISVR